MVLFLGMIAIENKKNNITEQSSTDQIVFLTPVNGSYGLVITNKYVEEVRTFLHRCPFVYDITSIYSCCL